MHTTLYRQWAETRRRIRLAQASATESHSCLQQEETTKFSPKLYMHLHGDCKLLLLYWHPLVTYCYSHSCFTRVTTKHGVLRIYSTDTIMHNGHEKQSASVFNKTCLLRKQDKNKMQTLRKLIHQLKTNTMLCEQKWTTKTDNIFCVIFNKTFD